MSGIRATDASGIRRRSGATSSGTSTAGRGGSRYSPGNGPNARGNTASVTTQTDSSTDPGQTRPLAFWLATVAEDAGLGLVLAPGLDGALTAIRVTDSPWRQRLQAYARVYGFDYEVGGDLLQVFPADPARRPVGQTALTPGGHGHPGSADDVTVTRILDLTHATAEDLAVSVSSGAKAQGVSTTADTAANALLLSGTPPAVAAVSQWVSRLDRPRRRVLLEARIVELSRAARLELGVRWSLDATVGANVAFPSQAGPLGDAALTVATKGRHTLEAELTAMESDGRARVVSRPRVVVVEGSSATIESVRILRIRLPDRTAVLADDVADSSVGASQATEEVPVGVRLDVRPALRAGGKILLAIHAESSSLGPPLPPDGIPEELRRRVDAEVLVEDTQTAVLGGLRRDSDSDALAGVPWLRRLPLFGRLFGNRSRDRDREELLILVTPTLLD